MITIAFAVLLAVSSSTASQEVKGESHVCRCGGAYATEGHYSWWFPIVALPSRTVTKAVNVAIQMDVKTALELRTLRIGTRCSCKTTEYLNDVTYSDFCQLTYASTAFVSLRCSTEVQARWSRSGIHYRSLILEVARESVRQIKAEEIFSSEEAIRALKLVLVSEIREIRRNPENERENMVAEADFPDLVDEMLRTAVLSDRGVAFRALGSHHSAFEVTIPFGRIKQWLNPKIWSDVRDQLARP